MALVQRFWFLPAELHPWSVSIRTSLSLLFPSFHLLLPFHHNCIGAYFLLYWVGNEIRPHSPSLILHPCGFVSRLMSSIHVDVNNVPANDESDMTPPSTSQEEKDTTDEETSIQYPTPLALLLLMTAISISVSLTSLDRTIITTVPLPILF